MNMSMNMTAPLEVGLGVRDLPRMREFYENALGCQFVNEVAVPAEKARQAALAEGGYTVVRLQTSFGERIKLLASFNLALRKRPVSSEQIDSAIERIEEKLLNLGVREVQSSRIGELVMRELKKLDKVAYIRFASVYRSFEDIDEFKTLVDEVRR